MPSLSAPELLGTWERGLDQPLILRALLLLRAAYPQEPEEWLAALSIGQRDAELFALREQLFGAEMACVEVCPQCGQRLDLTLNTAEIRAACAPESETVLSIGKYELEFRCPNSEDLVAALSESSNNNDMADVRNQLIERCLLSAEWSGTRVDPHQLPDEVIAAVSEQMAQADHWPTFSWRLLAYPAVIIGGPPSTSSPSCGVKSKVWRRDCCSTFTRWPWLTAGRRKKSWH
jgi:hypothetical protein